MSFESEPARPRFVRSDGSSGGSGGCGGFVLGVVIGFVVIWPVTALFVVDPVLPFIGAGLVVVAAIAVAAKYGPSWAAGILVGFFGPMVLVLAACFALLASSTN